MLDLKRTLHAFLFSLLAMTTCALAVEPQSHDAHAHIQGVDTREPIQLSAEYKSAVLAEMRTFLESVQAIMKAATNGKLSDAVAPATSAGMAAAKHMPPALMKALPDGFKELGRDTHEKFDAIAREAVDIGDQATVLKQVTVVLGNCNACHQKYRLVSP